MLACLLSSGIVCAQIHQIVRFGLCIVASDWSWPVWAGERWNHLHYVSSPHVLRLWKVCAMYAWRMRALLTPIKADGREESEKHCRSGNIRCLSFHSRYFCEVTCDWITGGLVDWILVVFGITYYHLYSCYFYSMHPLITIRLLCFQIDLNHVLC